MPIRKRPATRGKILCMKISMKVTNYKLRKYENTDIPICEDTYKHMEFLRLTEYSLLVPAGLQVGPPTCKYMYLLTAEYFRVRRQSRALLLAVSRVRRVRRVAVSTTGPPPSTSVDAFYSSGHF